MTARAVEPTRRSTLTRRQIVVRLALVLAAGLLLAYGEVLVHDRLWGRQYGGDCVKISSGYGVCA